MQMLGQRADRYVIDAGLDETGTVMGLFSLR